MCYEKKKIMKFEPRFTKQEAKLLFNEKAKVVVCKT